MTNRNDLITGVNAMFGGNRILPEEPESESREESRPKARTFLTGRRRKDDPRPHGTKDEERTSLILNKEQYAKVRAIALQEQMTIKELVYEMFKLGIERYEKKHGPVEVGKGEHDDLF